MFGCVALPTAPARSADRKRVQYDENCRAPQREGTAIAWSRSKSGRKAVWTLSTPRPPPKGKVEVQFLPRAVEEEDDGVRSEPNSAAMDRLSGITCYSGATGGIWAPPDSSSWISVVKVAPAHWNWTSQVCSMTVTTAVPGL